MEPTNETILQIPIEQPGFMASARRSLLKVAVMAVIALAFISAAPDKAWATFGVKPVVNCVTFDEFTNQIIVYWGFDNTNNFQIAIDNSFNFFVPGPGSDTGGEHIQFNTTTGEYLLTHCSPGAFTLSGKGVISIASGAIVITDQKADRLVKIMYLPNQLTGKLSLSFAAVPGVWSSFAFNASNPAAPCSCM